MGVEGESEMEESEYVVMRNLMRFAWQHVCPHEETYRGGIIWEICSACGAKWADDEGGKPEFNTPPEIAAAENVLAAHRVGRKAKSDKIKLSCDTWTTP